MSVQLRRQEIPGRGFNVSFGIEDCWRCVSSGKGIAALEGHTSAVERQDIYRLESVKWLPPRVEP